MYVDITFGLVFPRPIPLMKNSRRENRLLSPAGGIFEITGGVDVV